MKGSESGLQKRIADWDGVLVASRYHAPTDSWIFVALHDDTLGTPVGGTRYRIYSRPEHGLADAMRLAEGMTCKWAMLGLGSGGGKAVLCVPRPLAEAERRELFLAYAEVLRTLRGAFATGRDLGTTDEDMVLLAHEVDSIHGVDLERRTVRDPGPYTAEGLESAIAATLERVSGSAEIRRRSIVVEGAGGVGAPLARRLAARGARLVISDIDTDRARVLADTLGAAFVPPDEARSTECDIFAPCATGAALTRESIPDLRCGAVVGSANNQLGEDEDAVRLRNRGILYAPDFVANGGAALAFGLMHQGVDDAEQIAVRLAQIGDTLSMLYTEADERGEPPLFTARRNVEQILGQARAERQRCGPAPP